MNNLPFKDLEGSFALQKKGWCPRGIQKLFFTYQLPEPPFRGVGIIGWSKLKVPSSGQLFIFGGGGGGNGKSTLE